MKEHLNNILDKIDLLKEGTYKFNDTDIDFIRDSVIEFKNNIGDTDNINSIDLNKVEEVANLVYQLNLDNKFSFLTDGISTELYAFEFILEQKLKEKYL